MRYSVWFFSPIATLLLCLSAAFPTQANAKIPVDQVSSTSWWQNSVKRQITMTKDKHYEGCLFGDSISSSVGNTLGKNNFNFAIGGMSTVSLIEQLQRLIPIHVKCQKAIVAIGTNDAWYDISDDMFISNLEKVIRLLHSIGIQQIFLVPAFYSTVSASYDPRLAGTLSRVDEINDLIHQVAIIENVEVETESTQTLFKNHSLKESLTTDGVHLNQEGIKIYRQALLKIFSSTTVKRPSSPQTHPAVSTAKEPKDTQ